MENFSIYGSAHVKKVSAICQCLSIVRLTHKWYVNVIPGRSQHYP
jgi:hypothetical protein